MRPDLVVFLLPQSDNASGVVQGIELFHTEALIAEPAVERLDIAVSPRLAWRQSDTET